MRVPMEKKKEFVRKHLALARAAFTENWNSTWTKNLAHAARKELGYSEKTTSADIVSGMWTAFKEVLEEKAK